MKPAEKSPVVWPVVAANITVRESLCPLCQTNHHEPPGASVMCVWCGEYVVTVAVPE